MTDRRGHAADLAVLALGEFKREPGIGHVFAKSDRWIARGEGGRGVEEAGAAGERAVLIESDAAAREAGEGLGRRDALDLGPVFAAVGVFRIEELGIEAGLVAEQEEA